MADFILNAPDDLAEAEIVELLSKYPKRYLEKALSTPGDGDEKFIKKTLYDIKEASYLEHLERGERHKFWNPPPPPPRCDPLLPLPSGRGRDMGGVQEAAGVFLDLR